MPLTEAQVAYLGTRHRQSSHFAKGADEQFAPRALVSYYYQGRAGKKRDTGERTGTVLTGAPAVVRKP